MCCTDDKRVFLITGSSRGLGLGLVKHILDKYPTNRVIATTRNLETSDELVNLTSTFPEERLLVLQIDVTDHHSQHQAAESLKQKGITSIDVLIANAGAMSRHDSFFECSVEDTVKVWTTNVLGVLLTFQHFANFLLHSQYRLGVVVSSALGSIEGTSHISGYTCYRTSKAGVNMLAMAYANDEKVKKARGKIICLHPGWVQTDMGGTSAPLTVEQSVQGMLGIIDQACDVQTPESCEMASTKRRGTPFKDKLTADSCVFVSHDGNLLPW